MKESEIQFIDQKLKKSFEKLKDSDLKKFLERAFRDIQENPFCGIQIPKKKIPESYKKKYGVRNVWKYNLPGAWIWLIQNKDWKVEKL